MTDLLYDTSYRFALLLHAPAPALSHVFRLLFEPKGLYT